MVPEIKSFLSPRSDGARYREDESMTAKISGTMRESCPSEVEMKERASILYDLRGEQASAKPAMLGNATGQSGGSSHLMVIDSGLVNECCEIGRKVFFGFHRLDHHGEGGDCSRMSGTAPPSCGLCGESGTE